MEPPLRLRAAYVPVRRDDRHLQIGVDPPHRAVLPDTADVRRLLADLTVGLTASPRTVPARRALDILREAGLVVGAAAPPQPVVLDGPRGLVDALRAILPGTVVTRPADRPGRTALIVLLADGPLPRERTDALLRAGTPHLLVEGGPDAWTVGPLVVPGATACLRCVDAALGESDPRRSLVLDQLSHHHRLPAPDPLLQAIALPWAAREIVAYADGERPASWSSTCTVRRAGPPDVRT
ncbi:hypothetical protein AB3X52_14065 [Nocardioides sp. DS6]|uniref:Cyclodehydratase n=1 Tax=Nocardioides eburneus TaxID=3231482 RepID=A0ABV3T0M2_9ACTN